VLIVVFADVLEVVGDGFLPVLDNFEGVLDLQFDPVVHLFQPFRLAVEDLVDQRLEVAEFAVVRGQELVEAQREGLRVLVVVFVLLHQPLQSPLGGEVDVDRAQRALLEVLQADDLVVAGGLLEAVGADGVRAGQQVGQAVRRAEPGRAERTLEVVDVEHLHLVVIISLSALVILIVNHYCFRVGSLILGDPLAMEVFNDFHQSHGLTLFAEWAVGS
jgi:hypothetical protein